MTTNLVGLGTAELEALAAAAGEPVYRGRQLAGWIYRRAELDLAAMSDLPMTFRDRLGADGATCGVLGPLGLQQAADGTRKYLFASAAGGTLEAVLMPYWGGNRVTACISTQIGCAVGCVFCATGLSGFQRNVSAGEMVEQVLRMQRESGMRISNVVFMGMGEPLLNYDETLGAVRLLNGEVGIGMRHLTISTSGIVPGIDRLGAERLALTLAVSLHAPNDELRDYLVPINQRYPLAALKTAMRRYQERTGRRITVEYVLLAGVNDSPELAHELAAYLQDLPGIHVNLIPYNATGAELEPSSPRTARNFRAELQDRGVNATTRVERGAEIDGACGQLRRRLAGGQPLAHGQMPPGIGAAAGS